MPWLSMGIIFLGQTFFKLYFKSSVFKWKSIELAKKFVWVFLWHHTEKSKWTFWPTQYNLNPNICLQQGFPGDSVGFFPVIQNPPANAGEARDAGSISGLGGTPGVGNSSPLQYSCLENSMDRGAWWATVHGVTKSQTWLSMHTHLPSAINTCPQQSVWYRETRIIIFKVHEVMLLLNSQLSSDVFFSIPFRTSPQALHNMLDLHHLPSVCFSDVISYLSLSFLLPLSVPGMQPSLLFIKRCSWLKRFYIVVPSTCFFPRPPSLSSLRWDHLPYVT